MESEGAPHFESLWVLVFLAYVYKGEILEGEDTFKDT
jgi:hypothetical protein